MKNDEQLTATLQTSNFSSENELQKRLQTSREPCLSGDPPASSRVVTSIDGGPFLTGQELRRHRFGIKTEVPNEIANSNDAKVTGLRAAHLYCRDSGISDVTLWRWEKRGWIKTVNICGKKYVSRESIAEFERRAAAGEFSKAPAGAAGMSKRARAEKATIVGGVNDN